MNNSVLIFLRPFTVKQKAYVFVDGKMIEERNISFENDNLPMEIYELVNKYNLDNVNLSGPYKYSSKVGKDIQQYCITKYNKQIKIKYISYSNKGERHE